MSPILPGNADIEMMDVLDDQHSTESETLSQTSPFHTQFYAGAANIWDRKGQTFMDIFENDEHAEKRNENLYYPFATYQEWELASFLLKSDMSMAAINEFLKLQLIQSLGLSFQTALDLRSRAEILPTYKPSIDTNPRLQWPLRNDGLRWISSPIDTDVPTKKPIVLYYRDPLLCLQHLMHNPLVQDHISFTPFKLYESAAKVMRIYTEWLSGDQAWEMQTKLGPGATLLGVILSSDKTNITAMTGGRCAHPLLISLANLSMDFRNKATTNSYVLLALIPIPKFIHSKKKVCGMLEARLFHHCFDIIFRPLKSAARLGVMLSDPLGNLRWCFTPLAAVIVDTPESQLISCVGGKSSPVTIAIHDQFGDEFRHPPRTGAITLSTINEVNMVPEAMESLQKYEKVAKKYRLNGTQLPFWRDWPLSDPSIFLTSEPLHHWHKQFWDHDVKWCINAVGDEEFDFRFSVLHPHTGYRHFKEGVSKLKQVTGREQRDVQRYIVTVIADAVPQQFLLAISALMDFRYLAQSPIIDDNVCERIRDALLLFHKNKEAITDAGARRGKHGPILHWQIPKLELLQSVVPTIKLNGVASQWSADFTEHAHIPLVKQPSRAGSNRDHESQICRYLDRLEKIRNFDLAIAIQASGLHFGVANDVTHELDNESEEHRVSTTGELLPLLSTFGYKATSPRPITNYFYRAELVKNGSIQVPLRTFQSASNVVCHLNRDPTYSKTSIKDIVELYNIPDLPGAIADFISRIKSSGNGFIEAVGGRRSESGQTRTRNGIRLQVWTKFHLQTTAYHYPHDILPPVTLNAIPPSQFWEEGQYDSVIINVDQSQKWPKSGLTGHIVAEICLIFCVDPLSHHYPLEIGLSNRFLAYVRRYDIVKQQNPELNGGLYLLKKATRANGERIGDIVPLDQIRALADLAPRFGSTANAKLTSFTSMAYSREFWLNKYFNKELFYALS